jgi:hypothetical protein
MTSRTRRRCHYFKTKSEIVLAWSQGTTRILGDALRSRPSDEDPITSLREAFIVLSATVAEKPSEIYAASVLIERTSSLRPHSLQKHAEWENALSEALRERLEDCDYSSWDCFLLARAAVAAFRTAELVGHRRTSGLIGALFFGLLRGATGVTDLRNLGTRIKGVLFDPH